MGATVSVSMNLLSRKPPIDYKDPNKDMVNKIHIHSRDTRIILEAKV